MPVPPLQSSEPVQPPGEPPPPPPEPVQPAKEPLLPEREPILPRPEPGEPDKPVPRPLGQKSPARTTTSGIEPFTESLL
jgi:hypothetical protein